MSKTLLAIAAAIALAVGTVTANADAPPPKPKPKQQTIFGKHHASPLQKFGIGFAACEGGGVIGTVIVKGRLPRSNEAAPMTVKCVAVGGATIASGWAGAGAAGTFFVDDVVFDGKVFRPIVQPFADAIQPLFAWLDPPEPPTVVRKKR